MGNEVGKLLKEAPENFPVQFSLPEALCTQESVSLK